MHEAEDEAEARCYDSVMLSPRGQRGLEEHHWFQLWIPSILHIVRLSATTTSLATKDLLYTRSLLVNGAFWPFTDTSDRSWIYTVHSRTRCRGADTEVTEPPTLTSTCSRLCWLTVTQPERERESYWRRCQSRFCQLRRFWRVQTPDCLTHPTPYKQASKLLHKTTILTSQRAVWTYDVIVRCVL